MSLFLCYCPSSVVGNKTKKKGECTFFKGKCTFIGDLDNWMLFYQNKL
jgi:hypothetical protein